MLQASDITGNSRALKMRVQLTLADCNSAQKYLERDKFCQNMLYDYLVSQHSVKPGETWEREEAQIEAT